MNDILETNRLKLIPKTVELVKASFYGVKSLEESLGFYVDEEFLGSDYQIDVFPLQYARITDDPSLSHWSGFIIEKGNKTLIGVAGFENKPDEKGEVEIKFYIDPLYRRKGYATEIVLALKNFYFEKEEVKAIIATRVSVDNTPAIKVLHSIGMKVVKQRENELNFAIHKTSNVCN